VDQLCRHVRIPGEVPLRARGALGRGPSVMSVIISKRWPSGGRRSGIALGQGRFCCVERDPQPLGNERRRWPTSWTNSLAIRLSARWSSWSGSGHAR
jgi:hypothetical protein